MWDALRATIDEGMQTYMYPQKRQASWPTIMDKTNKQNANKEKKQSLLYIPWNIS